MEARKPIAEKLEAFFAGKGFYIVLALCLTVIGVSAWAMLRGGAAAETPEEPLSVAELIPEVALPASVGQVPVAVTEAPAAALPEESAAPAAAEEPEEPAAGSGVTLPEEAVPAAAGVHHYFVWPVTGETERAWSVETLSFDPTMQDWRTHDGIDVGAPLGTPVRACSGGRVAEVYEDERLGTVVVVSHDGGLRSLYANLAALPAVSVGDVVESGQVIGSVGATALCEIGEASHLHFALYRDGVSVDPASVING